MSEDLAGNAPVTLPSNLTGTWMVTATESGRSFGLQIAILSYDIDHISIKGELLSTDKTFPVFGRFTGDTVAIPTSFAGTGIITYEGKQGQMEITSGFGPDGTFMGKIYVTLSGQMIDFKSAPGINPLPLSAEILGWLSNT